MKINYDNKTFKAVQNSEHGEVSSEMLFHYKQQGTILTCEYFGGKILKGHLIGIVDKKGTIKMRYHQINQDYKLKTGKCISTPEILPNGKIRLHENWEWTSGNQLKGMSILEEI